MLMYEDKKTINRSCNYEISFVLLPTRLINNLFQLMTIRRGEEDKEQLREKAAKTKRCSFIFLFIFIGFSTPQRSSAIIKIRNHLVRFTSHSIKLRCLKAGVVKMQ